MRNLPGPRPLFFTILILHFVALSGFCLGAGSSTRENEQSQSAILSHFLNEICMQNPQLASLKAQTEAEEALIPAKYAPNDPRLSVMRESNLNFMQQQMGPMNSIGISQDFMFPSQYFLMAHQQRQKWQTVKEELRDKQLALRQEGLSYFFKYQTAFKILSLLEAQKETLREIARIAETRRATGAVSQQDEMKAHLEQTKIENEIILQQQEIIESKASINALLNRDQDSEIILPQEDPKLPQLSAQVTGRFLDLNLQKSSAVASKRSVLAEMGDSVLLARANYLPNFTISYRRPFGENAPANASALALEITFPLWFWAKQNSELSATVSKEKSAKKELASIQKMVEANSQQLASKIKTLGKLLTIIQTALVPQATSTLNSSRLAYSTGRTGFQDLLDAERSLYSFKIDYYRHFATYVETITRLERELGTSLSDLPMEGEMQ